MVSPAPGEEAEGPKVDVWGWAWYYDGVAVVGSRDFSWQRFAVKLNLPDGTHTLRARATSLAGVKQPLMGRRNHVHSIVFHVIRTQTPFLFERR